MPSVTGNAMPARSASEGKSIVARASGWHFAAECRSPFPFCYGILLASHIPQIQSIVAWGAIRTFQRFDSETQRRWRESGYLGFGMEGSGNQLRLNVTALDALERNADRLDVLRAMRGLSIPALLLHGREDQTVPLEEGQKLWQCADQRLCRFHVIEGAGHAFRTQHPFTGPSQPLLEAVSETIGWFEKTLR
jgi:pimeloyl-ACP methyl ester carboxylesterase